jgi:hypothetical protein
MKTLNPTVMKEPSMESILDDDGEIAALPPYSTLVNEKIVIPSSSTPYFAVEQHFFFTYMKKVVSRIYVDEEWYLTRHPDVKDALDKGKVVSARDHYARFGYYEHRLPHPISVNAPWYLETYPDVHESIKKQHFPSAANHFEAVGYREGRLPHAGFQLQLVTSDNFSSK